MPGHPDFLPRSPFWCLLFLITFVLGIPCTLHAADAAPADTADVVYPRTVETDTIQVTAKKLTLREILQRAIEGERGKLAGHQDMTCTITTRAIIDWKKKRKIEETVYRAYSDASGNKRTIQLDEFQRNYKRKDDAWVLDETKANDESPVQVRTDGHSDFEDLPFFLEDLHEYDFSLLDRTLEKDHVIFKIGFRPKSDFKPLPSGVVYVDTDNYRIIHEVFEFDRNPFPLFMKDLKRMSRHWAELPGGEWVFTRIMLELDLRADPFGYIPRSVALAMVREDFRFDDGYDADLFGELPGVPANDDDRAHSATEADTVRAAGLLGELQREDMDFFRSDLLDVDPVFRDTVIALHDSLGLKGFESFLDKRGRRFGLDFGPGMNLWNYNRVEGLVMAGAIAFQPRGPRGFELDVEGAYATASKEFRYFTALTIPWRGRTWETAFVADYADRVVPFGTNRPTLSSVRAIVGGADDQDYMQSTGGSIGLTFQHNTGLDLDLGFAAAQEDSISRNTDFSIFGDMSPANAQIDQGEDRSVVGAATWASSGDRRQSIRIEQRVAGGSLGGDFTYSRTDVALEGRRFIVERNEVFLRLAAIYSAGSTPKQRIADVGGLSTVRGYDRRTLTGQSALAARLEYLVPYDIFAKLRIPLLKKAGVQFVPWAEAARVWDGNSESWITALGLGFQRYLGPFGDASNLRLDFAFPVGPEKQRDFRLYLSFMPELL